MALKLKEEEEEIRADLKELETYHASDDSHSQTWGDKKDRTVVYEWEDFFTDWSVPVADPGEQKVFHSLPHRISHSSSLLLYPFPLYTPLDPSLRFYSFQNAFL